MNKKTIVILLLILFIGVCFRFWNPDVNLIQAFGNYEGSNAFYSVLLNNQFGFLEKFISDFFAMPYVCVIKPFLSQIWSILGLITFYFIGCEAFSKKGKEESAAILFILSALSPFLIYLSFLGSSYSLIFLLSSLILLFSLRIFHSKNSKDIFILSVLSLCLILLNNLSIFFVAFNFISLFVFLKNHKTIPGILMCLLGVLILLLPLCPFVLNCINQTGSFDSYAMPFDYNRVLLYFGDVFSPKLMFHYESSFYNFGTILFLFIPTLAGLFFTLKSFILPKKEEWYTIFLLLSNILSIFIICFTGGVPFSALYLITLVPLLILSFGKGISSLKSKNIKIITLTIYLTINLVCLTASHFPGVLFF